MADRKVKAPARVIFALYDSDGNLLAIDPLEKMLLPMRTDTIHRYRLDTPKPAKKAKKRGGRG